ncbi:MAG: 2-C-methyl-D-erythritol 4-phosphate cytidylyltransferase [Lentisphaeria bacterium]|nr:2-C-methyl-D-erythritol 4-phosphate cytidylyltransferase [Lentisphaeria bacterium]
MKSIPCAIIVTGGGSSTRYGNGNKLLEVVGGVPVFIHSIRNLAGFAAKENFILTVPAAEFDRFADIAEKYGCGQLVTIVRGGSSRAESVNNALDAIQLKEGQVAIHDAARPLVTAELLRRLLSCGKNNVIAATQIVDSVKRCDNDGKITEEVDRTNLWRAATPQVFDIVQYRDAVAKCISLPGATDDATIMRLAGYDVYVLNEEIENIKLTTTQDLEKIKKEFGFRKLHKQR